MRVYVGQASGVKQMCATREHRHMDEIQHAVMSHTYRLGKTYLTTLYTHRQ